ncbi:MAG: permease [Clostridia bacterium]|nr:permease [Clostridia bacterium]
MSILNEIVYIISLVVYQFKLIFGYWAIGILAGVAISVFAGKKVEPFVLGVATIKPAFLTIVFAAILGAASPLCMYGTVPMMASLGRKGLPHHLLVAFMISSVLINPNLFIVSLALGMPMALLRLFMCIAAGVLAGVLAKRYFKGKPIFNFSGFEEKEASCSYEAPPLKRFLKSLNRTIVKTGPYFLAGLTLTALFDRFFPKEWLYMLFGSNNGFGVLLAASLGVPLYLCGGGTVPLIKAWLYAGMSPGSAIAFMAAGASTKINNLSAVKMIFGAKKFSLYIAYNLVFAAVTGLAIDLIYSIIK